MPPTWSKPPIAAGASAPTGPARRRTIPWRSCSRLRRLPPSCRPSAAPSCGRPFACPRSRRCGSTTPLPAPNGPPSPASGCCMTVFGSQPRFMPRTASLTVATGNVASKQRPGRLPLLTPGVGASGERIGRCTPHCSGHVQRRSALLCRALPGEHLGERLGGHTSQSAWVTTRRARSRRDHGRRMKSTKARNGAGRWRRPG